MSERKMGNREMVRRRGPGPMGPMIRGEKAKDFKGSMAKLVKYLSEYKISIIIVFIFAAASAIFSIIGPKILGRATTKIFEGIINRISGTGEGIDFKAVGSILLFSLGLYLISAFLAYAQGWIMSGVSMKMSYRLRRDISQKINRMPLKYFDGTNHGDNTLKGAVCWTGGY